MDVIRKTLAYASSAALLAGMFAPGALAAETDILGNGAFSVNTVDETNTQTNTTVQNNSATINNTVDVSSNTGGNVADYNTGGNVGIGTGNSITGVQITNMANLNVANNNSGGLYPGVYVPELPVTIQGNGAGSFNSFDSTNTNDQAIYQTNEAYFSNTVAVDSNTGFNNGDYNTGGNTSILTGNSQTGIGIQNTANANYVGGSLPLVGAAVLNGLGGTGTEILNNGALSSNSVTVDNSSSSLVEQFNNAVINNAVAVTADTGNNTADQNTGGNQLITTGLATITAGINNLANFNSANLPYDSWLAYTDPLIYGNGAYSANSVDLSQTRTNLLYQGSGEGDGNQLTVNNALAFTPDTGDNDTSLNTLLNRGFTQVLTGSSGTSLLVNNTGNVNSAGGNSLGSFTLPGGTQLNLGFNLGSLFHL